MKRWKIVAGVAAGLLLMQISGAAADNAAKLSVDQVVQLSQQNNIDDKVTDFNHNIANLRAAYTPNFLVPGSSLGPWNSVYSLSVAPLLSAAKQQGDDYTTLDTKLQRELNYYNNAYTYWLLQKTMEVKQTNMNLATKERDATAQKVDAGVASQNDLLQSEVSRNQAIADYENAKLAEEGQQYRLNQSMGNGLPQEIDIADIQLSYLSPDELDVSTLIGNMENNHQSLGSLKASLNAYQKALTLAGQQDPANNVPVKGLTDYYQQEVNGAQLQLTQRQQQLELSTRSYVDRLTNDAAQIKLNQDNVDKMGRIYDNATKQYDVGLITFNDLENARLSLLKVNLALYSAEKDYMSLKEEFSLFKQGYMPPMQ